MGNRVGVITTRSVAGPLALGPDPGPVLLVALVAERGPINVPQLITSESRLRGVFGNATPFADGTRYSSGFEVLRAFFAKGGRRAYALRIAGSSAATASVTLVDRDSGTALDTLTVTSKGPGTFLDGKKLVVTDGTRLNTFKLSLLDVDDSLLETFDNLKIDGESIERVNGGSDFIQIADEGSATAAPDNRPALGTTVFSTATHGGADDNAPAAAEIVGTSANGVKEGLKALRSLAYGYGFVCAPDLDTDTTVQAELIEQSEDYFRVWLTSSQEGASVAQAKTQRGAIDAFNALFHYPRARMLDAADGSLKTIPVSGHVVADWISAIATRGPGKTPGGSGFRVDANVIGVETQANGQPLIDDGVAEDLVGHGINPIWSKDGGVPRVWGVRAATEDAAWAYIHAAYLWCTIGYRGSEALDRVVLDVTDETFFSSVEDGLYILLADLHQQGAFQGEQVSPGDTADPAVHSFGVIANEDLLSVQDKSSGNARARVWFRPAGLAETVFLDIAKQNEVA